MSVLIDFKGRGNIQDRGRRLLIEGRLRLVQVSAEIVRAECRGSATVHRLGYQAGQWRCSCFAKGLCSHLVALQLVVLGGAS